MKREKIITAVIIVCFFGGSVGGPVASLVYYFGSPEERFQKLLDLLAQAFWFIMESPKKRVQIPNHSIILCNILARLQMFEDLSL